MYKMHLSASTTSNCLIYEWLVAQCENCTEMRNYTGVEKMDKWLENWVEEIMKNWEEEVIA